MALPSQSDFIENEVHNCEAADQFHCTVCVGKDETQVVRIDHNGRSCYFHRECLISWFTSTDQKRGTCPNDRAELFEPDELEPGLTDVAREVHLFLHSTDTPAQIVSDYGRAESVRLRALARGMLASQPDAQTLASDPAAARDLEYLQSDLVRWALFFHDAALPEVKKDLSAAKERIGPLEGLVSRCFMSHDWRQRFDRIKDDLEAIGTTYDDGPSANFWTNAIDVADELLALYNRIKGLLRQIGELEDDDDEYDLLTDDVVDVEMLDVDMVEPEPEAELGEDDLAQIDLALEGLQ